MFINWNVTTRFDPNSLQPSTHGIPVPSYGNYGGPNYSAGVEGGTTPETPTNPAPVDALDFLFWQHDLVYQHVQNGAAPPTAIAPADVLLVEGMYGLTQTDFFNNNPEALLYDALGTLTIVGKILTTPEEFAYFKTLSPSEQYLVGVLAPQEAVQNFEIGLAETPGNEARSLHGAFQVFEAHFAENIAVAGAFGTLNDAGQITGTHFHASAENSFLADPNPTATPDRANLIFSQTLSVDAAHGVLANDINSLPNNPLSVTTVNGQSADVGHTVAGAATGHAADTFVFAPNFGQSTTGHVLANDPGSLSVTTVNGQSADVGHTVAGAATGHAADTFVFAPNFGQNTITNFNVHNDTLELPKSEFADLATVLGDAHQNGIDTVIAHDVHDMITLHNVNPSQLHDSHI
jgi:hypothetical protein